MRTQACAPALVNGLFLAKKERIAWNGISINVSTRKLNIDLSRLLGRKNYHSFFFADRFLLQILSCPALYLDFLHKRWETPHSK